VIRPLRDPQEMKSWFQRVRTTWKSSLMAFRDAARFNGRAWITE